IGSKVVNAIIADPESFGITDTTQPPAGPFTAANPYNPANGGADINPSPSTISNSWALFSTQLVSPNAGQTNLWADDQHLSAAGQQAEANYLHNLIENATPVVSETLTASGQVALDSSATFTYQWQSLAPGQTNWSNIAGATGSTYVVQQADLGSELRVEASYTDSMSQTTTAFSSATPAVVNASPASTSVQQEVLGLYAALYNRAAEFPGYSFWVGLDRQQP